MKFAAFAALCVALLWAPAVAAGRPALAFVPIDDRPVTYQLPEMIGAIAGVDVLTPPRAALGNFLHPGDPSVLWSWLLSQRTRNAFAYVLSTDMLAYGGLVASRTPSTPQLAAQERLNRFINTRVLRTGIPVLAFGTVMRLAPTGVAKIGAAADFFAAGPVSDLVAAYARLPDPPQNDEQRARAEQLRSRIGAATLQAYLQTRTRNREVDAWAISFDASKTIERLILGQDDAGTVGLHLRDIAFLRDAMTRYGATSATIESGTDELGMVLVSAALAERARWAPAVSVTYSRPDGGTVQDPLELGPVDQTVNSVIASCGGRRVTGDADIELFVRVTKTSDVQEAAFVDAIARAVAAHRSVAVADLTFLGGSDDEQKALVQTLLDRNLAGSIDGFASWNTAANTLGTAIPAAVAAGVGRRLGTYDATAHQVFLLDRYADDYGYRLIVRSAVNDDLAKAGIKDHSYLLPPAAQSAEADARSRLEPIAFWLLDRLGFALPNPAIIVTLPWNRTFEARLDILTQPK